MSLDCYKLHIEDLSSYINMASKFSALNPKYFDKAFWMN